jgi:cell filamentation protein
MYLQPSLAHISAMPQQSFEQIVEKYVEMNVAPRVRQLTT